MAYLTDIDAAEQEFWGAQPCGSTNATATIGTKEFFEQVERHRYSVEYFIPKVARFDQYAGKKVLEIGVGLGTDLSQFARHGAECTGLDLTPQCIAMTKRRFELFGLRAQFHVGSATALPFGDCAFDHVYSWGVLLTIPRIGDAVSEVFRVLKPGGTFTVMLYHRHSLNYWFTIRVLRRLGFRLLRRPSGIEAIHRLTGYDRDLLERYRRSYQNIVRHYGRFTPQDLLNESTDGPGHPYSTVWSRREARLLFERNGFVHVKTAAHYLVKKNLPLVGRLIPRPIEDALGRLWGFFLVITGEKANGR
jgi:ubiquinone/menaquinone biosynthesis C-methylase UbiE